MDLAATASGEKAEPANAVARWRSLARRSELALILLAVATGVAAAVFVALTSDAVQLIHHYCFGLPGNSRLSGADELRSPYFALVPAFGGALLGLTGIFIKRWRPRRPVDAIEANALRGGRMSLIDSILITLQTIVSCGFGASVGLEAGYTQIGAGFGSTLGSLFKMRRADMRALVGCGAAGAIAAAFQAPLTGAFYAFELIIGTYTSFGLAPVIAAAISAVIASRALGIDANFVGHFTLARRIAPVDFAALFVLTLACAAVGIAIMRGVTFVEAIFKRSRLPVALQPIAGGLLVGGLALLTPHVLASGHGALAMLFRGAAGSVAAFVAIVALKSVASAISIGSGFRGGLFFASLYLGGLMGKVFCGTLPLLVAGAAPDVTLYILVGMAALGRRDHRRAADHELSGAGDDRRFSALARHPDGRDARLRHRAPDLRLFLRDLAAASARRIDPQRAGYRLDAVADGRPADACRSACDARRPQPCRFQGGISARRDELGRRRRCCRAVMPG